MKRERSIGKMKKLIEEKKLAIVLSLNKLENGATLDYDVMSGDRLLAHVCSLHVEEEEFQRFVKGEIARIERRH